LSSSIATRFEFWQRLPLAYQRLAGALVIAVVSWLVYQPALGGGFILDDDTLLTENTLVKAPDGLTRIWFSREPVDYWPVSNSSLWLEWRIWESSPKGYHAVNLLLHVIDSLLVWLVLENLSIPGAFLAALLFAVHPVNVESVAWISQRKGLLALMFALVSTWLYLKSQHQQSHQAGIFNRWYALCLLAFLLAMLSKGSVAVLPLLLLLCDWWRVGRLTLRNWTGVAPFFVIAAVLTLVNLWFRGHGAEPVIRQAGIDERLLTAADALWFYLGKAIMPLRLSLVYPKWEITTDEFRSWLPLLAAIACTCALFWKRNDRRFRLVWFGWCWFCLALLPVLGFVDVGFMQHSLVADHYQHLALVAVVALAGAACFLAMERLPSAIGWLIPLAAVVVCGWFALLAHQRAAIFADGELLYANALQTNPDSWLAHNNLGNLLLARSDFAAAEAQFELALATHPIDAKALNNLGVALMQQGHADAAVQRIERAIEIKPNYPQAHFNLALAQDDAGNTSAALAAYRTAIQQKPDFLEAYISRARLEAKQKDFNSAVADLQQALSLAHAQGNSELAVELNKSLEAYRELAIRGKPAESRPAIPRDDAGDRERP
jgi:tetratricopeptide (TPR) repeat protein